MKLPKENYINVWREESADILLEEFKDALSNEDIIKMLSSKKRELSQELEDIESLLDQSTRLFA